MGLKLEVGKYYKTRDGRKVELLAIDDSDWNGLPLKVKYPTGNLWLNKDGIMQMPRDPDDDLIAEWTDAPTGPVRTVTTVRKELVNGKFGIVHLSGHDTGFAQIKLEAGDELKSWFSAAELRSAIVTLTEIADALEEQA